MDDLMTGLGLFGFIGLFVCCTIIVASSAANDGRDAFIRDHQKKPYCVTEMAHEVEYTKCYKVVEVPHVKEGE